MRRKKVLSFIPHDIQYGPQAALIAEDTAHRIAIALDVFDVLNAIGFMLGLDGFFANDPNRSRTQLAND